MIRRLALLLVLAATPAVAQETLADIRTDLVRVARDIAGLRGELAATGAQGPAIAGTALDRLNALEEQLTRLTAKAEALEMRINRVVTDATNRIGDLEFRLVELEGGDLGQLGQITPLGGDPTTPAFVPGPTRPTGVEMAVGERADFDRARAELERGNHQAAAAQFAAFVQNYPGGPMTGEAEYLRGEALDGQGQTAAAARAWLQSFSDDPGGARAPDALYRLGTALHALGQASEACVTLSEVPVRYPGTAAAGQAIEARTRFGCR